MDLVVIDHEIDTLRSYIAQCMDDICDYCNAYSSLLDEIKKDGLDDSSMQKIIEDNLKPVLLTNMYYGQVEAAYNELVAPRFLEHDLKSFIAKIDELDSILY